MSAREGLGENPTSTRRCHPPKRRQLLSTWRLRSAHARIAPWAHRGRCGSHWTMGLANPLHGVLGIRALEVLILDAF